MCELLKNVDLFLEFGDLLCCYLIFPTSFALFLSGTVKRGRPTGYRAGAVRPGAYLSQVQRVEGGQCTLGAGDLCQTRPAGGIRGRKSCSISHCRSSGGDQFIKTLRDWFYCLDLVDSHTLETRTQTHTHTLLFSIETTVPYQLTSRTIQPVTGSMKKSVCSS